MLKNALPADCVRPEMSQEGRRSFTTRKLITRKADLCSLSSGGSTLKYSYRCGQLSLLCQRENAVPVRRILPVRGHQISAIRKRPGLACEVGSVVLAPGFKSFDPGRFDSYAYTRPAGCRHLPGIRAHSISDRARTAGHLVRPVEHAGQNIRKKKHAPKNRLAAVRGVTRYQPLRSTATARSVCCMYAVKQAVMAKGPQRARRSIAAIFYMDMRTQGKDFDRYY